MITTEGNTEMSEQETIQSCRYCRLRTPCCSHICRCRCRSVGQPRWRPSKRPWRAKKSRSSSWRSVTRAVETPSQRRPLYHRHQGDHQEDRRALGMACWNWWCRGWNVSSCSKSNKPPRISRRACAPLPAPVDGGAEVEALHRAILELAAKALALTAATGSRATEPDAHQYRRPFAARLFAGVDAQPRPRQRAVYTGGPDAGGRAAVDARLPDL